MSSCTWAFHPTFSFPAPHQLFFTNSAESWVGAWE